MLFYEQIASLLLGQKAIFLIFIYSDWRGRNISTFKSRKFTSEKSA